MAERSSTVLVTGAAQGIGAAVAAALVEVNDIIAVDRDGDLLHEKWKGDARVRQIVTDLRDRVAVRTVVSDLASEGVVIDALVNNAGIGARYPFYDLPDDRWDEIVGVNLTGTFVMSAACWSILRKPGGVIVNISSIHGQRPLPGMSAYAASKGGIESLTRAMAIDGAPEGVRAVAIAPGFVHTDAWDRWVGRLGAAEATELDERVANAVPLRRQARPEEVADAVRWCISDTATYLTGTTITLDGGVTALAYRL